MKLQFSYNKQYLESDQKILFFFFFFIAFNFILIAMQSTRKDEYLFLVHVKVVSFGRCLPKWSKEWKENAVLIFASEGSHLGTSVFCFYFFTLLLQGRL